MEDLKRENIYLTIKYSDVEKYLSDKEKGELSSISSHIHACRINDKKQGLKGVVIESHYPEYERVLNMIEERVTKTYKPEYNHRTWAELKIDCYDGEKQDKHRKYWEAQTDGDMQSEVLDNIDFPSNLYPAGTKITVEIPSCPECYEDSDLCSCGFDWHGWVEDNYS